MMAVRAVNMAVFDFFCGCRADAFYFGVKADFHAGQRMVAVYHNFAFRHIFYAEYHHVSVRHIGFKHHAGFDFGRESVGRFDTDEVGVMFAESIVGL